MSQGGSGYGQSYGSPQQSYGGYGQQAPNPFVRNYGGYTGYQPQNIQPQQDMTQQPNYGGMQQQPMYGRMMFNRMPQMSVGVDGQPTNQGMQSKMMMSGRNPMFRTGGNMFSAGGMDRLPAQMSTPDMQAMYDKPPPPVGTPPPPPGYQPPPMPTPSPVTPTPTPTPPSYSPPTPQPTEPQGPSTSAGQWQGSGLLPNGQQAPVSASIATWQGAPPPPGGDYSMLWNGSSWFKPTSDPYTGQAYK